LEGLSFIPENIVLDKGIYATEEAYKLVQKEDIPFRDAYKKIAKKFIK